MSQGINAHHRRCFIAGSLILASTALSGSLMRPVKAGMFGDTSVNEDGLYTENWMRSGGKNFTSLFQDTGPRRTIMVFEARGCPLSENLHKEPLKDPTIAQALNSQFDVYQFNVNGGLFYEIPAYGLVSERCLTTFHFVQKTPTMIFFGNERDPMGIPVELGRLSGRIDRARLIGAMQRFAS